MDAYSFSLGWSLFPTANHTFLRKIHEEEVIVSLSSYMHEINDTVQDFEGYEGENMEFNFT